MKKASDLLEITSLVTENVFRSRYIGCVYDVCVCEKERGEGAEEREERLKIAIIFLGIIFKSSISSVGRWQ